MCSSDLRVNRIGARREGGVTIVRSTKGTDPVYGDTAAAVSDELRDVSTLGQAVDRLRHGPDALRLESQEPVTIPPSVLGAYTRTAGLKKGSLMEEVFIGRQAILDQQKKVYVYEILFRSGF